MSSCCACRGRRPVLLLFAVLLALSGPLAVPSVSRAAASGIRIVAIDADGHRVNGACYWIDVDTYSLVPCDVVSANGMNGVASVYLQPGTYTMGALRVPPGFRAPSDRSVTVRAGRFTTVTITYLRGANTLRLRTVNAADHLIDGACFLVSPQSGRAWASCDEDDGNNDGVVRFGGLRAHTPYYVTMFAAPTGYATTPGARNLSYPGGGTTKVQTWVVQSE